MADKKKGFLARIVDAAKEGWNQGKKPDSPKTPSADAVEAAPPVTPQPATADTAPAAPTAQPSQNLHTSHAPDGVKQPHNTNSTGAFMQSSDIKTAKVKFGANAADPVSLVINDVVHTPDASGAKYTATIAGKPSVIEADALRTALLKAGEASKKSGPLEAHEFEALHKLAQQHSTTFAGSENPFAHIVKAEGFRSAYEAGDKHALGKLLVAEEEAGAHLGHVPANAVAKFRRTLEQAKEGAHGEFQGHVKQARTVRQEIAKIDWNDAKFDKAGAAKNHVDEILAKQFHAETGLSHLEHIMPADVSAHLGKGDGYGSMSAAISGFDSKVQASDNFLRARAQEIRNLNKEIKGESGIFGSPKKLAAHKEALKDLEKTVAEHLAENTAHGVAMKKLPEDIAKTLNASSVISAASSKAVSAVGSGVANAGKEGGKLFSGGDKFLGLWHNAETVGTKVEKIGKFRMGKAALIGAPVVLLGGYLAGIGRNPDKGKYTQMVANDNEMQAGAAVSR